MKKILNYDSACDFSEGLAGVCRDGKWGFIDTSGREVVPCKYDAIDDFHEGMARVNVGGRWRYDEAIDENYISGGRFGFIDKTGREEDEFDCEFEDDEYVQCISRAEGRARAMGDVVRDLEALLKKIDC